MKSISSTSSNSLPLREHIPTLTAVLANRLRSVASRSHRREHNLGVVEWRVLVSLLNQPNVSAYRIGRETDLNKAAISRVLSELKRKGWVEISSKSPVSRSTVVSLTNSGNLLARELSDQGIDRQAQLLQVLSVEEQQVLKSALQKLIDHVPTWEAAAFSTSDRRSGPLKGNKSRAWSESDR